MYTCQQVLRPQVQVQVQAPKPQVQVQVLETCTRVQVPSTHLPTKLPVWHHVVNCTQAQQLESIQKRAIHIFLMFLVACSTLMLYLLLNLNH